MLELSWSRGLSESEASARVLNVMVGLRMYVFMNLSVDELACVFSVALRGAAFNPSWHLTAAKRCSFTFDFSYTVLVTGASASPAAVAELGR